MRFGDLGLGGAHARGIGADALPRGGHIGLRLLHRDLEGLRIDAEQHRAGLGLLVVDGVDFAHAARNFGRDADHERLHHALRRIGRQSISDQGIGKDEDDQAQDGSDPAPQRVAGLGTDRSCLLRRRRRGGLGRLLFGAHALSPQRRLRCDLD